MRILYGINGEGLGHLNRSKVVIKELTDMGHTVLVASSHGCSNFSINSMRFKYKNGKIRKMRLLWDWLSFPMRKNLNKIPKIHFDLVITDFEPVTARYARKHKINLVSIDNQHRFSTIDTSLPLTLLFYNIVLSLVNKIFIGKTDDQIVTCFHPHHKNCGVINQNRETQIEDPLSDVLSGATLVYIKEEHIQDFINSYDVPQDRVTYIFCDNPDNYEDSLDYSLTRNQKSGIIETRWSGLCFMRKGYSFKQLMKSCRNVITNAGNQTIGECIKNNIPITCIPVKGQAEQEINGYYLEKYNYGKCTNFYNFEVNYTKPSESFSFSDSENGIDNLMKRLTIWLNNV